ncbi:hypothetical protein BDA96_04G098900 [Sorghum bicolor]|uniref:Uncharacterized protein n=1 Tax=Sorghum bicolor TaxID=4558 RepID=A0A921R382_SORBI|nr:hypothetical protein BDA96_04G098900 [Sorghum bicolor]
MIPEKLLESRLSLTRLVRLPIPVGISPIMLLKSRDSTFRFTRLPMLEGILPVSLFWSRLSNSRLCSELNSLGISPCKLLLMSEMLTRWLQFESEGGICPWMEL